MELRLFAGQVLSVILGGESHLHDHLFAANLIQQLLFKTGNKHTAAQNQGLILCGTACELLTLTETGIIQNHLIALLGRAVGDLCDPGVHLLQTLQLTIHFLVGNNVLGQGSTQALVGKTHIL